VTEGLFDLRPYVERYGLPERMDGMRALEVGTWDGFWAFEMEHRRAEIVALDLYPRRNSTPAPTSNVDGSGACSENPGAK
jgi:hypothetical protein